MNSIITKVDTDVKHGVTKHRTGLTGPKYWSFVYEKG